MTGTAVPARSELRGYQLRLFRVNRPGLDPGPAVRHNPREPMKTQPRINRAGAWWIAAIALLAACSQRQLVLELQTSVLYEKPSIASVSHVAIDSRNVGGGFELSLTMEGDPGLEASFDISPGIVDRQAMVEVGPGRYEARFEFPAGTIGGPYTVVGRLAHPEAGEVTRRDPESLSIGLVFPSPAPKR